MTVLIVLLCIDIFKAQTCVDIIYTLLYIKCIQIDTLTVALSHFMLIPLNPLAS